MIIKSSLELLGEIRKFMFLNKYNNETIASKRNVSAQSISNFFNSSNPNFNTILETIDALDSELYIEIRKKE